MNLKPAIQDEIRKAFLTYAGFGTPENVLLDMCADHAIALLEASGGLNKKWFDKNMDVHFSSAKADWGTPKWLFEWVQKEVGAPFLLDLAANEQNALCNQFIGQDADSLIQPWAELLAEHPGWLNPPYGRGLIDWVSKADSEGDKGASTAVLIPARPDTKWASICFGKGEVWFFEGRLTFGDTPDGDAAPFPSMLVLFGPMAEVGKTRRIKVKDIQPASARKPRKKKSA